MQFSLISATGLLLLAPLASAADAPKQAPKEDPKLGSATSQGCFNSARGLEKNNLELTKLSSGTCNEACKKLGKAVFAMAADGCYCGNEYPPKDDISEDSACNNACPAYPLEACGGLKPKSYSVWNTGVKVDVSYLDLTVTESERQDSPDSTASGVTSAINSGVSTAISSYGSSGYSSYPSSYGGSSGYSYPTSYGSSGYSYPTSYGSSGYNYDSSVAASGVSTAAPTGTAASATEGSSTGAATADAASAETSTPSSGSRSMIGAGVAILAAAIAI